VAIGKYAQEMVANNLNGDFLTPHGPQSAWKFCLDKNAYIISLGVELPKYLTIIHAYEECHPNWPISDWFQKRKFIVKDKEFVKNVEVYERKSIWGKYFFAERNLRKDLIKNGVLEKFCISGLEVNIIRSNDLLDFLNNSQIPYPYYIKRKYIK
jgi:aminoglycoside N3'-acetyltransferase